VSRFAHFRAFGWAIRVLAKMWRERAAEQSEWLYMADGELLNRWKTTRWHLERAHRALPRNALENKGQIPEHDLATVAFFQEYLDHNELEMALDQLEGLGALNKCRGGFWRSLERASQSMGFHSRAAALHRKFEQALDNSDSRNEPL
jgi:hypothetical protein